MGVQSRAARALLGWEQKDLAARCNVSPKTITRFENGKSQPHRSLMIAIQKAFDDAGIEFIDAGPDSGPGVRLRRPQP